MRWFSRGGRLNYGFEVSFLASDLTLMSSLDIWTTRRLKTINSGSITAGLMRGFGSEDKRFY
jgi:hypothetical protein